MGTARRLLLAATVVAPVVVMLPAGYAAAQTMPWPGDAPRGGAPAPWPGSAPGGMSPMMGAPSPPMGGGGMMGGGGAGMGAPGGGAPPCMAEFTKLREEVEKHGKAAKAASARKVGREEMCKYITTFADAEAKWVNYTEKNTQTSCGIPVQVASQLKQMHANTEQTRQKICAAGPAGVPAGPSLSGTLQQQVATPDNFKAGNGTLDTMTGSAIR